MSTALYDPIKTMSKITDTILVAFSTGKDSIVVLDLCKRYFKNVYAFFEYFVPNVGYEEQTLKWYESHYDIQIMRVPCEMVTRIFHYGLCCPADYTYPIVSETDLYYWVKAQTGCYWLASGERKDDSLQRRGMITNKGTIDRDRGRMYPVANWSRKDINAYIKYRKLKLPSSYRDLNRSLALPYNAEWLKDKYPDDYDKVVSLYPFIGVLAEREKNYGKK